MNTVRPYVNAPKYLVTEKLTKKEYTPFFMHQIYDGSMKTAKSSEGVAPQQKTKPLFSGKQIEEDKQTVWREIEMGTGRGEKREEEKGVVMANDFFWSFTDLIANLTKNSTSQAVFQKSGEKG